MYVCVYIYVCVCMSICMCMCVLVEQLTDVGGVGDLVDRWVEVDDVRRRFHRVKVSGQPLRNTQVLMYINTLIH